MTNSARRWKLVSLVSCMLGGLATSPLVYAFVGLEIENFATDPATPTTYQSTSVVLDGWTPTTCTPQVFGVGVSTGHISIALYRPQVACGQAFTPFTLEVPMGQLEAGTFEVAVREVFGDPLGAFSFEVSEPVGATLYGASPRKTICINRTSGQRIVVRSSVTPIDCAAAGLLVSPRDNIAVRMEGTAQ